LSNKQYSEENEENSGEGDIKDIESTENIGNTVDDIF